MFELCLNFGVCVTRLHKMSNIKTGYELLVRQYYKKANI